MDAAFGLSSAWCVRVLFVATLPFELRVLVVLVDFIEVQQSLWVLVGTLLIEQHPAPSLSEQVLLSPACAATAKAANIPVRRSFFIIPFIRDLHPIVKLIFW
jgi:hypothetical protein